MNESAGCLTANAVLCSAQQAAEREAWPRIGFLTDWDDPPAAPAYGGRLLETLLVAGAAVTLLTPASPRYGVWRKLAKRCTVVELPGEPGRLDPRTVLAECRRARVRHLLIQHHPAWLRPNVLTALVEECAEQRIQCVITLHEERGLTADRLHLLDRAGATLVVPTRTRCEHLRDQGIVNVESLAPGVLDVPSESLRAARASFGIAQGPVIGVAGEFQSTYDSLLRALAVLRPLHPDVLLLRPARFSDTEDEEARATWGLVAEQLGLARNVCLDVRCAADEEMVRAFQACDLVLLLPGEDEDATLAAGHLAVAARRPLAALPPWDVHELGDVVYRIESAHPPVVALAAANILASGLLQESLAGRAERYAREKGWHAMVAGYRRILLGDSWAGGSSSHRACK